MMDKTIRCFKILRYQQNIKVFVIASAVMMLCVPFLGWTSIGAIADTGEKAGGITCYLMLNFTMIGAFADMSVSNRLTASSPLRKHMSCGFVNLVNFILVVMAFVLDFVSKYAAAAHFGVNFDQWGGSCMMVSVIIFLGVAAMALAMLNPLFVIMYIGLMVTATAMVLGFGSEWFASLFDSISLSPSATFIICFSAVVAACLLRYLISRYRYRWQSSAVCRAVDLPNIIKN